MGHSWFLSLSRLWHQEKYLFSMHRRNATFSLKRQDASVTGFTSTIVLVLRRTESAPKQNEHFLIGLSTSKNAQVSLRTRLGRPGVGEQALIPSNLSSLALLTQIVNIGVKVFSRCNHLKATCTFRLCQEVQCQHHQCAPPPFFFAVDMIIIIHHLRVSRECLPVILHPGYSPTTQ